MFHGLACGLAGLGDLAPNVPTPTPVRDIDLDLLGPPPPVFGLRPRLVGAPGDTPDSLPAGAAVKTAADLKALIAQNNGALFVWTSDASKSPELQIAKANPLTFKVEAVPSDPGTYKITLGAVSNLGSYVPYIALGVGSIVILSMLKR